MSSSFSTVLFKFFLLLLIFLVIYKTISLIIIKIVDIIYGKYFLTKEFDELIEAIKVNNTMKIYEIVKEFPSYINKFKDPEGYTPFMLACGLGNTQVVKLMLANGADLKLKSKLKGETCFYLAAFNSIKNRESNNASCIRTLYYAGADINEPNSLNLTALQMAAFFGHDGLVEWLILKKAKINVKPHPFELAKLQGYHRVANFISNCFCPTWFDGWTCWPKTVVGEIANRSCPEFIAGFEKTNLVFYKCDNDGTWHIHKEINRTWVNYTTCVNTEDIPFRTTIVTIHSVGYGISLIALLISLALLFQFKSLRCVRIIIHMNLFASFAINNFLWLLWYYSVIDDADILLKNEFWCIAFRAVLYTFLLSNYSWMLCEGLYLHTVLVWTFMSQNNLLLWMNIIGWGIPLVTTIIYVPVRALLGEGDELKICWLKDFKYDIIQQIPVAATIGLNLIFLINIVRVVVLKLRRGPANDGHQGTSRATLQALRATLLLVPLLGLNFLLTPFRPQVGIPWEYIYDAVSAIITSLQGLCVAILFCFCNGEVQAQIKRRWRTAMFRPRNNSCTVTTVSVRKFVRSSYPHNDEEKV